MRFCHLFVSALALFVMLACTSRGGKKVAASSATAATLPPGCIDLSGGYGADTASSAFYYRGRLMVVSDAGSFRVLADGYAADDSSGYFEGRPFRAQFPHTLAAVGGGYAKDRFSAYYRGRMQLYNVFFTDARHELQPTPAHLLKRCVNYLNNILLVNIWFGGIVLKLYIKTICSISNFLHRRPHIGVFFIEIHRLHLVDQCASITYTPIDNRNFREILRKYRAYLIFQLFGIYFTSNFFT